MNYPTEPELKTYRPEDDEISLVDLAKVLIKRRTTLFIVFGVVVAGGVLAAFLKPETYEYKTTIEIGTRVTDNDVRLIDNPETLRAKIQESYIPAVFQQYKLDNPEDDGVYGISARVPKKSEVIVLEAKGKEEKKEIYKQLEQKVIDLIVQDHERLISVFRQEHRLKIEMIQNEILDKKDEAGLLKARIQRLKENVKLTEKQIAETRQLVQSAIRNRQKAGSEVSNESSAMTLLMIDNQIQQNRRRLDDLEEKLTVTLENEIDQLENQLTDVQRQVEEKQTELKKARLELKNLRDTRALVPPMKSIEPVGMGRKMMLLLSGLLGIFVALFAAFVHEFIVNARAELASDSRNK